MKEYIEFEINQSGADWETQQFKLDSAKHSEGEIRSLVKVIVKGLFQTEAEIESSNRSLKISGKSSHIRWASKKIQSVNPDVETFEIPAPFKAQDNT